MSETASTPFLPCPITLISGNAFSRKASSSRAGFSSSTMIVFIAIYSLLWRRHSDADAFCDSLKSRVYAHPVSPSKQGRRRTGRTRGGRFPRSRDHVAREKTHTKPKCKKPPLPHRRRTQEISPA